MPQVTKHSSNNLVTVSYPVREAVLDITKAEHDLIVSFSQEKVKMIKFIRGQYNLGLYDAKQVVDTVIASVEVKPEVKPEDEWVSSGINWSAIAPGTVIYVRDSEHESWIQRKFIAYDCSFYYRFTCKDDLEGAVVWKYAKLINA